MSDLLSNSRSAITAARIIAKIWTPANAFREAFATVYHALARDMRGQSLARLGRRRTSAFFLLSSQQAEHPRAANRRARTKWRTRERCGGVDGDRCGVTIAKEKEKVDSHFLVYVELL
jgi:hypothetical protein